MQHSWVFEVLSDLRAYALSNGLPRLACKTAEALAVAREEVAGLAGTPRGDLDEH